MDVDEGKEMTTTTEEEGKEMDGGGGSNEKKNAFPFFTGAANRMRHFFKFTGKSLYLSLYIS